MSKNSEILLTDSAVDFLKEEIGGGGATVVANPELSGDEADLTGLQVGDTKYKVPSGSGIEYIRLNLVPVGSTNPGIISDEDYNKLIDGNALILVNGIIVYIPTGYDENDNVICSSVVMGDSSEYGYYKITISYAINSITGGHDVIPEAVMLSSGEGSGVEFVPIDIEATSINLETLEKLVDFNNNTLKPNFIVLGTDNETDTFPILMPSDTLQKVYRSAVMGDKYYQLTLDILEDSANVNIEQISVGGGGGIDNLCDYYPKLVAINGKQMFSDSYNYYLDVDGLVQYVEDSGIGDIPFEPDINDTYPNCVELIPTIVSGLSVFLQTQTSNSNSYLSIEFAGDTINVEDLINNEGDTLAVFLTRNKNAIKEVFNGNSYSGFNIRNMLDSITNNEMCICRAWERVDTNPTYVHSMNLMKFLELFHR